MQPAIAKFLLVGYGFWHNATIPIIAATVVVRYKGSINKLTIARISAAVHKPDLPTTALLLTGAL